MKTVHRSILILFSVLSVTSTLALAETQTTAIEGVTYNTDKPLSVR